MILRIRAKDLATRIFARKYQIRRSMKLQFQFSTIVLRFYRNTWHWYLKRISPRLYLSCNWNHCNDVVWDTSFRSWTPTTTKTITEIEVFLKIPEKEPRILLIRDQRIISSLPCANNQLNWFEPVFLARFKIRFSSESERNWITPPPDHCFVIQRFHKAHLSSSGKLILPSLVREDPGGREIKEKSTFRYATVRGNEYNPSKKYNDLK